MVDDAGGRSQLAQLATAAVVLVVLLFLTKPLSYMPEAVLAAVVFLIGVKLVDVKGMRDGAAPPPGRVRGRAGHRGHRRLRRRRAGHRPGDRCCRSWPTCATATGPTTVCWCAAGGKAWTSLPLDERRAGAARPPHVPLRLEPLLRQRQPLRRRGPGPPQGLRRSRSAGSASRPRRWTTSTTPARRYSSASWTASPGRASRSSPATFPSRSSRELERDGLLAEIGQEHVFGDTDDVIKAYKSRVLGQGRDA